MTTVVDGEKDNNSGSDDSFCTDISGESLLSGSDEDLTMEDRELQNQILQNFVAQYKKGYANGGSTSMILRQETGLMRGHSFSPTAAEVSERERLV